MRKEEMQEQWRKIKKVINFMDLKGLKSWFFCDIRVSELKEEVRIYLSDNNWKIMQGASGLLWITRR